MTKCTISLERRSAYYPGSEIQGNVVCQCHKDTTIRSVKLQLKFEERTHWTRLHVHTDPQTNEQKTEEINVKGNNEVIYLDKILYKASDGERSILPRGTHTFPFSYILPSNIPSTYSCTRGSIDHVLKATMVIPMGSDFVDKTFIKVDSKIDFNKLSRRLQQPATYSEDATVCCFSCQGGEMTMTAELPKTAFVPGETINCKVSVTNMSNTNITHLTVNFRKTVTYTAYFLMSETKEDVYNLISIEEHGVGAHCEHTYDLQLTVPQHMSVLNFLNCQLFDVEYLLTLTCHTSGFTPNMTINVCDIVLGDVAFVDLPPSLEALEPSAPPSYGASVFPEPSAPSALEESSDLPPSYEEVERSLSSHIHKA